MIDPDAIAEARNINQHAMQSLKAFDRLVNDPTTTPQALAVAWDQTKCSIALALGTKMAYILRGITLD